tara:strand:- start:35520 stop:36191 length:672 start_codon:yes stop_codon:yes gene_type:complete
MKNSILVLIVTICFGVSSLFGQQKLEKFEYKGKTLNYTILLPSNFDATKSYPVLVGPSDTKLASDQSFYWRGTTDSQGWILIGYKIYGASDRIAEVKALLNHIKSTYRVEGNKFHTVCFSANSAGIFDLVMNMPEYFAGITGMAGNPNNRNKERLKKLKGVKVQFVVGDRDTYWMNSAKRSHQILRGIGVESSIEIIKNGQHVMKPLVGKGFLDRANRLRKSF